MTEGNPKPDWKAMLALSEPQQVIRQVNGVDQAFYPITVQTMFKLRDIGTPISQALAVLFSKNDNDARKELRQVTNTEADGSSTSSVEDIQEKVELDTIMYRDGQKRDAIKTLLDEFTSAKNLGIVGDIIRASMRDIGTGDIPSIEFMNALSLDIIVEMVSGVLAANAGVFEPIVGKLTEAIKERMQSLTDSDPEVEESNPSSETETQNTVG